ncbi:hypothetical protein Tco_1421078 [Tanacetum coccineum]
MVLSDEEEEVHAELNAKTKDTSVPTPPSPKSIKIQELTNQVLLLQSQNIKLKKEKAVAEAKVVLSSAQPSFPNVQQLTELLVQSLKPKLSKLLIAHNFSTSLLTKLKDLPSKIVDINEEIGDIKIYVEELEVEIIGDLKELPGKLEEFQSSILALTKKATALENLKLDLPARLLALPGQVSSINVQLSKLKVLDALRSLLNKVTKALDRFAHVIESTSQKYGDTSVPSAGQAGTQPAEGEKYQATITQLFQIRFEKDVAKANLKKETNIPTTTTTETTTSIPLITTTSALIIPTTLLFQSPFLPSPPKTTPQPEGEQVKDKGKKVVSHEELVKKESKSDSDVETRPSGSLVETSKQKPLKKITCVNEKGEIHQMTEEEIKNQKGIEQTVKANAEKSKINKAKQDLIDLLGFDVVEKMYKDKVKHDVYYLKITEAELELGFSKPLDEQDPIIKLNLLAKKKRKTANDLHDYFRATKRYKTSVQFNDHQAGTVLNEPSLDMNLFNSSQRKDFVSIEDFKELNNEMMHNVQEILFKLHQRPGINDLARTFSTFLVAEVEKRNLNPNKQMRLIEQMR